MSEEAKTFQCSTCGGPVTFEGDRLQAKCGYCGATVMVPEELRPQLRPQPQLASQVVVVQAPAAMLDAETAGKVARGVALSVLVPVIIVGIVVLLLVTQWPGLVTRTDVPGLRELPNLATSVPVISQILPTPTPSFARLEMSLAGKGTGDGLFQDVRHIAVDGQGNVYAVEYDTLRIQKFDGAGKFALGWTIDEKATIDAYRKRGPDAIAADADGNVYALWDRSLLKYSGDTGKLLAHFALEKNELGQNMVVYKNTLIAFANNGFDDTLLWIDTSSGKIVRRAPKLLSSIADDNLFVSHMKLAVDGLGNIFVLYTFSGKHQGIYRFSPEGKYLNRFSPQPDPNDTSGVLESLAVDNQSRLYVSRTGQITVFDDEGRFLQAIPASLYEQVHSEFAIDRNNNILILNRSVGKIFKLSVGKE